MGANHYSKIEFCNCKEISYYLQSIIKIDYFQTNKILYAFSARCIILKTNEKTEKRTQ